MRIGSPTDRDVIRRLTAVLAADIAGYSRLMAGDEVGTLDRLKSLRATVIDPLVSRHHGEVVGSAGDSLLVAFGSAIDAVACALAWQEACEKAVEPDLAEQRMLFRIGLHLGDVIPEEGTIYGDGVNIAARLEKLAEPGGVTISRAIREQIEGRFDLSFVDLGRQELKNIPRPVEAFEIRRGKPATKQAAATGGSASAKLSIAILPFSNMSGDKEQDYFSDGITEDLITEISRFRELNVIARNSSFAFRGQNLEIAEIARRLNVQYVVEGSVRKAGNHLRINVQLIEAGSDRHVWAERYDRDLDDIFAVQDEIAHAIASVVVGHVKIAGAARTTTRPTESLSAYDLVLRARVLMNRYAGWAEPASLITRAIELDPDYAMPHAIMANALTVLSLEDGDLAKRERAVEFAKRAIVLDPDEPWGHAMLGYSLMFLERIPEAGMHFDRAQQLNPHDVYLTMLHGIWYGYAGHVEQALAVIEDVLKRDPFGHDWYWDIYCDTLVVALRYEEAIAAFNKMVTPASWSYLYAAIAQVNLGNLDVARTLVTSCRQANPALSPEEQMLMEPFVDKSVTDRLIADLRKAL